jgi:DNA-binding transcriptional ArsR family regulator
MKIEGFTDNPGRGRSESAAASLALDRGATPGARHDDPALDLVIQALSSPVRRFLLELLEVDDATAGELAASAADNFGISLARASQHLQVLARAELVIATRDGTWRNYRRIPSSARPLTLWLQQAGLS